MEIIVELLFVLALATNLNEAREESVLEKRTSSAAQAQ